MSDAPDLAPCPFCGGEAHYNPQQFDEVYCVHCDISMGNSTEAGTCVDDWNRRAPRIATAEMVEKVLGAVLSCDLILDEYEAECLARAALRALGYEVRE